MFGNIFRFAGDISGKVSNAVGLVLPKPPTPMAQKIVPVSNVSRPNIPPDVETLHDGFTTYKMHDLSNGSITPMSRTSASALTGNYIVETGDPTLSKTDVVEVDAGEGRGLAQYTGARRGPYDQTRLVYSSNDELTLTVIEIMLSVTLSASTKFFSRILTWFQFIIKRK